MSPVSINYSNDAFIFPIVELFPIPHSSRESRCEEASSLVIVVPEETGEASSGVLFVVVFVVVVLIIVENFQLELVQFGRGDAGREVAEEAFDEEVARA